LNSKNLSPWIYFAIQLIILLLLVCGIAIITTPFPIIVSLINNIRPDQPFQFYSPQYHSSVVKISLIIILGLTCVLLYFFNKKKIIINKINDIIIEYKRVQIRLLQSINNFFKTENTFHIILLLIMFIVGFLIRVFYINRPVFHDEAKTFYSFISSSWLDAISNYYVPNNHVFHSICARFFYVLLGNEEWVFRIPVFISGVLCSLLIYIFALYYYNKHIALLLTAMNINALPLVFYSVNARGYIIITLCFLCLLVLIKMIRNKESVILWFLFVLIATVGVWTVPTMVISVILLFIWYLLNSNILNFTSDVKTISIIGLICIVSSFIVYSPIILRCTIGALISNQYVQSQTLSSIVLQLPNYIHELWLFVSSGYSTSIELCMILFLLILGIYYHLVDKNHRKIIYSTILLFIVVLFVMRKLPYARTLLFLYPVIWSVIVAGLYMVISTVSHYLKININKSVNFLSMFLFIYSSVNCLADDGIIEQSKDQTCQRAEEIIADIKKEFGPNDIIETSSPLAGPIRYYLIKSGIDQAQFYWYSNNKSMNLLSEPDKIYVITRDKRNSLESFGYTTESSIEKYAPPKLWKKYMDGVNIYIVTKSI